MLRGLNTAPAIALMLAIIGIGQASAHSFDLGFVAPLSGPQAQQGRQALDGFLLATRERDGHALEESDGHLGGLDVYVLKIDSADDRAVMRARLDELLGERQIAFLTGIFESEKRDLLSAAVENTHITLVDPADSAVFRSAVAAPHERLTMNGDNFLAAFRGAYGYPPDEYAIRGYIAARLIDAGVRAVAGEMSQRSVLNDALRMARERLP